MVAVFTYLLFYGSNGLLGGWLMSNLQMMLSPPGDGTGHYFVTRPFVVRELVPVMLSQGSQEDVRRRFTAIRLANVSPRDVAEYRWRYSTAWY